MSQVPTKDSGSCRLIAVAALTAAFGLLLLLPTSAPASAANAAASSCPTPPTDLCTDYVLRDRRWRNFPIPYYVNAAGAPPGAVEDVRDAFSAWENEVKSVQVEAVYPGDKSTIAFSYAGHTALPVPKRDGLNTVIFRAPYRGGAAQATIYTRGSEIIEFDIQLNLKSSWQTDVSCPTHTCGKLDVQNTMTHEVGHVLDLYHVSEAGHALLTMYPFAANGVTHADETAKRDLGAGDVLGLRTAYPAP